MAIRDYVKRYSVYGFQDVTEIPPENYERAVEIIKKEHARRVERNLAGEVKQIRITIFSNEISGNCVFEADVYCPEDKIGVCIGKVKNKHTSKVKGVDMIRIISQNEETLSELEIKLGLKTGVS